MAESYISDYGWAVIIVLLIILAIIILSGFGTRLFQ